MKFRWDRNRWNHQRSCAAMVPQIASVPQRARGTAKSPNAGTAESVDTAGRCLKERRNPKEPKYRYHRERGYCRQVPQRAWEPQRAQMQLPQRAWILKTGASKSTETTKRAGTAGRVCSSKSVGTAGSAGIPQVAVTATTSTRSAVAAGPGSTGIKKGCKSARTSRKKKGGGVSLLACRQYRRETSAKGNAIRIGVVSIRNCP